jgi:hypothetical protein
MKYFEFKSNSIRGLCEEVEAILNYYFKELILYDILIKYVKHF